MEDVYLTLDLDWAPDAAIDAAAEILEGAGCRATWFVTHRTPALDRLRDSELFELGVHPNFLPGSTHGQEPEEVLRHVLEIVPEARCVRAHAAFQSGPVLKAIRGLSQIELDCSVMLPGLEHARPVPYGDGVQTLWRVPNFWSDDYEAEMREPNWALDGRFSVPGTKILIFHPIHVALNSSDQGGYSQLKRRGGARAGWSGEQIDSLRRDGSGAATLLEQIASRLGRAGGGLSLSALIPESEGRAATT
jgi:hypothetical protein